MGASKPIGPRVPPVQANCDELRFRTAAHYSYGWVNMRNVYAELGHDVARAEAMRNVYQPPPEPRIVLPGEVWRYIDEDESQ